ncbi:MAG: RNA polymerase sporulation sigma factor SigK [Clostridia bacterium]|nr:RNA polymerase sporulation sigma factor SigK [Clostridia bacterium]
MFSFLWLLLQSIAFIGAIGSNGSFPKPLSPEEEQKWVQRLIAGDDEAREKLIVHNLRLCAHIAKKYQKAERDREDLISIGTIGLIKAVSTFSESKGTLSAYAARCIENEILMSMRRERKLVETVSIEEPVGADKEGNELRLADLVCTEADTIFEQVQSRLDAAIITDTMRKVLTKREQVVLMLRFGLNGHAPLAQREVANVLDISRSYVSRIEKKAVEKMRAALGGAGGQEK